MSENYYDNGDGTYSVKCSYCKNRVVRYCAAPTVCDKCREYWGSEALLSRAVKSKRRQHEERVEELRHKLQWAMRDLSSIDVETATTGKLRDLACKLQSHAGWVREASVAEREAAVAADALVEVVEDSRLTEEAT